MRLRFRRLAVPDAGGLFACSCASGVTPEFPKTELAVYEGNALPAAKKPLTAAMAPGGREPQELLHQTVFDTAGGLPSWARRLPEVGE